MIFDILKSAPNPSTKNRPRGNRERQWVFFYHFLLLFLFLSFLSFFLFFLYHCTNHTCAHTLLFFLSHFFYLFSSYLSFPFFFFFFSSYLVSCSFFFYLLFYLFIFSFMLTERPPLFSFYLFCTFPSLSFFFPFYFTNRPKEMDKTLFLTSIFCLFLVGDTHTYTQRKIK
jgi:hypothetical protein